MWKKKCELKVSETCSIKPKEGKWIYVNYGSENVQPGDYLQPMLLNTIIEQNLHKSKFSPRAGRSKAPAIFIINNNDFFVQLKRGEMLGTLASVKRGDKGGSWDIAKEENRPSIGSLQSSNP